MPNRYVLKSYHSPRQYCRPHSLLSEDNTDWLLSVNPNAYEGPTFGTTNYTYHHTPCFTVFHSQIYCNPTKICIYSDSLSCQHIFLHSIFHLVHIYPRICCLLYLFANLDNIGKFHHNKKLILISSHRHMDIIDLLTLYPPHFYLNFYHSFF